MSANKKYSVPLDEVKRDLQIEDMTERFIKTRTRLVEIVVQYKEAEDNLIELERQYDVLDEKVQTAEKNLLGVLQEKLNAQKEYNILLDNSTFYKEEEEKHQKKIESLQSKLISKEERLVSTEQKAIELVKNIEDLRVSEVEILKYLENTQRRVLVLESHKKSLEAELKKMSQTNKHLKSEVSHKQGMLLGLGNEISSAKQHLDTFEIGSVQIKNQKEQISQLEAKINANQYYVSEVEKQIAAKEEKKEVLDQDIQHKIGHIKKEKLKLVDLKKETGEFEKKKEVLTKIEKEVHQLSLKRNDLESVLKDSKKEKEKIEKKCSELQNQQKLIEKKNSNLEQEHTELTVEVDLLSRVFEDLAHEQEQNISQYVLELENLEISKKTHLDNIMLLTEDLERLRSDISKSTEEYSNKYAQVLEQEKNLEKNEKELSKQDKILQETNRKVSSLNKELSDLKKLKSKKEKLDKNKTKLETEIEILMTKEKTIRDNHENMRQEISLFKHSEMDRVTKEVLALKSEAQLEYEQTIKAAELSKKDILEKAHFEAQKLERMTLKKLKDIERAEIKKLEIDLHEKEKRHNLQLQEKSFLGPVEKELAQDSDTLDLIFIYLMRKKASWKSLQRSVRYVSALVLCSLFIVPSIFLIHQKFPELYKIANKNSASDAFVKNVKVTRELAYVSWDKDSSIKDSLLDNLLYTEGFDTMVTNPDFQNDYIVQLNDFILNSEELHEDNVIKILEAENSFMKTVWKSRDRIKKEDRELVLVELKEKEKKLNDTLYKIFLTKSSLENYFRFRKNFYFEYFAQVE